MWFKELHQSRVYALSEFYSGRLAGLNFSSSPKKKKKNLSRELNQDHKPLPWSFFHVLIRRYILSEEPHPSLQLHHSRNIWPSIPSFSSAHLSSPRASHELPYPTVPIPSSPIHGPKTCQSHQMGFSINDYKYQ